MQRTVQKLKHLSGVDALMQCMLVSNNLLFDHWKNKLENKIIPEPKSNALNFSATDFSNTKLIFFIK